MPFLDLSDIIGDPDFADTFFVTRRAITIGTDGRTTITSQTPYRVLAIVDPTNGRDRRVDTDAQSMDGKITVFIQFPISIESPTNPGDLITWNNANYLCKSSRDYSRFGAGWYEVVAELYDLTEQIAAVPS